VKIELNPVKWFAKSATAVKQYVDETAANVPAYNHAEQLAKFQAMVADTPQSLVVSKAAKAEETVMANKFVSVMEAIAKGFEKGLTFAVQYAVPVEKLVALLFPGVAPEATVAADATTLIQNAVLLVEQKYAASGQQSGTGAQKLAEVLTLTQQAVTGLLAQMGITADTSYIASLVSAVVAILNVQDGTAAAVAAAKPVSVAA
jgi:hypothetical protein